MASAALRAFCAEMTELPGIEEGDQECADARDDDVGRVSQLKIANVADQQVADDEIEEAPKHIDDRRRQSFSGRRGEWALEGASHHAAYGMGHCVGQEATAKEISEEGEPGHFRPSVSGGD